MKEFCVYWLEEGEPMHKVFPCLAEAEMFLCVLRGRCGVEYADVCEEDIFED